MSTNQPESATHVLFVCMGNICRSPMAEGVFRKALSEAGRTESFRVDSAGTHGFHTGHPPDRRAQQTALRHGVDISQLRARAVDSGDFYLYDYILAADEANLAHLRDMKLPDAGCHPCLLMPFAGREYPREIPDPYYGPGDGFERVFQMIEAACAGLLDELLHKE